MVVCAAPTRRQTRLLNITALRRDIPAATSRRARAEGRAGVSSMFPLTTALVCVMCVRKDSKRCLQIHLALQARFGLFFFSFAAARP